ncbi:MAG: CBS domain-containing protein [Clostridia bacterium]|nr:CBS domain-containing protein [Clostridia bacterium]
MNVAFFLKPKISVAFLYSDFTLRQALEKMHYYGYTAIPVIGRDGKYNGTVSEGDFLWYMLSCFNSGENVDQRYIEEIPLKKILKSDSYKPVKITANMDELFNVAMNQNFVPVVDDLGSFIGIVTRRDIIKYLSDEKTEP